MDSLAWQESMNRTLYLGFCIRNEYPANNMSFVATESEILMMNIVGSSPDDDNNDTTNHPTCALSRGWKKAPLESTKLKNKNKQKEKPRKLVSAKERRIKLKLKSAIHVVVESRMHNTTQPTTIFTGVYKIKLDINVCTSQCLGERRRHFFVCPLFWLVGSWLLTVDCWLLIFV